MKNGRKRVHVLINPRSGPVVSSSAILGAIERELGGTGVEVTYQFSRDVEDGRAKTQRAVKQGADTIIVVGGDGMINTIGSMLVGADVNLAVVPTGSGNGFARHFNIPLNHVKAVQALSTGERMKIDVGTANDRPFFVTCSMAADAATARYFAKSPMRGIIPYVFATAYELFEYKPQRFDVVIDGKEQLRIDDVLVFTVANLTQFGGGARIAPDALPDDGRLEMVALPKEAAKNIFEGVPRLFNGTFDRLPGIIRRRFQHLVVRRRNAAVIQVDGEVVEAPAEIHVRVKRRALSVLVPPASPRVR